MLPFLLPTRGHPMGLPAQWQSGYAADCKSVYVGSIPACASKYFPYSILLFGHPELAPLHVPAHNRTSPMRGLHGSIRIGRAGALA